MERAAQIGIWPARVSIELGKRVELRAAVQNVSNHPIGLGQAFGLAVKHGEEVHKYFGGPRSSEPIFLEPGEFKEILGWSLGEESSLKVGLSRCWVIYRAEDGEEIRSAVAEVEMRPLAE